jgi:hypothetical protein
MPHRSLDSAKRNPAIVAADWRAISGRIFGVRTVATAFFAFAA